MSNSNFNQTPPNTSNTVPQHQEQQSQTTQEAGNKYLSKIWQISKGLLKKILGLIILFILAFLYLQYSIVQQVRQSVPEDYPELTMEKAFDDFFENPKWSYERFTGEYHIVHFSGECLYLNEQVDVDIEIRNRTSSDHVQVYSLEFDDVPQSDLMLSLLLTVVYESYDPND